jgi:PQQ-dependent dehydrogenase (methanol/ethanol family)
MGIVSEPIVVDGVAYVSAPQSKVYAVDAATGKLIWKFDPKVRLNLAINGSYSARTNAGVAVWEGKVFVGTGDCRLVAIDAASGKQAWESPVCDRTQTGITGAPHVAKNRVFMGYNGSDDGVRGALVAFDAETGKEVWRFWTVPGEPTKRFETKALEMAAKTWSGPDSWRIGGADVWNAITYDPVTDYVIFGTAGAGVDYGELSSIEPRGDKLFSGCILAVKAETGEYVWHYQTSSPGLQTENNHIVMADLNLDGEKRHVAMTVPKHGFYYVLDAKTGKLLSARPIVKVSWATSVDLSTGKAVEVPASAGGGKQWTVHNWWPMSYDPGTGIAYIPATDRKPNTHAAVETGEWMQQTEGRLIAWDPVSQSERWSVRCVHRRYGKESLVDSNRIGDRVHSRNLCGEWRAICAGAGGMGLWFTTVCSRMDDGHAAIQARPVTPACFQTERDESVPDATGCSPSGTEATAATGKRRGDSRRRDVVSQVCMRRVPLSGT